MRNLNENTVTDAVLQTISAETDHRLREVVTSLVKHLHAFAIEVGLRPDEWMQGIQYLYDAGKMSTPERNEFILTSDILGLSSLIDMIKGRGVGTGTEYSVLGPFFVEDAPEVSVGGDMAGNNPGVEVVLSGRILDEKGKPVGGARIDLWQNQDNGLYDVQETHEGAVPNLRCHQITGADGRYGVRTIRPVSYKVPDDGPAGEILRATGRTAWRPAHYHVWINAKGYRPLVTELFPGDDPHINGDAVFGVRDSLRVDFSESNDEAEAASYGVKFPYQKVDFDFVLVANQAVE
ncbi:MAG: hydroxyquinol 1,2-dioxygenase [Rhodospirillaceae bacterium]|nr:hydroxyquinol 1,2-dioxygenase [Rhodospirillaceae bacterium]MCY4239319.1 hydroxyquinol 1,2-dioxygenase [Rhodospirillaceae bacterium]